MPVSDADGVDVRFEDSEPPGVEGALAAVVVVVDLVPVAVVPVVVFVPDAVVVVVVLAPGARAVVVVVVLAPGPGVVVVVLALTWLCVPEVFFTADGLAEP